MKRALDKIRDNIWLRISVLAIVLLVVTWFTLPNALQQALWLKVAFYVGPPILISLPIFGATAWVTYKLKPALWAGAFAFAAVLALVTISQEPRKLAGGTSEASRTAPQPPDPFEVPSDKNPSSRKGLPDSGSAKP
jgi:hypothetical protein